MLGAGGQRSVYKTMVYLTETQRMALTRYARKRSKAVAAVIREAVDRLLAEEKAPQSRFVGIGADPEGGPISERVEETLGEYLRKRPIR